MSESMAGRSTVEVVQIVTNGGGVTLSASRGATARVQIAANMTAKATLRIVGSGGLRTVELVQIAQNAKGAVHFD